MRIDPFALLLIGCLLGSCGSPKGEKTEDNSPDRRTTIRLQQYMVQGKQLYLTHCSNCHQNDGSGLARLYPPLANSDYLLENLARASCMIKNGMTGEIIVNGISYNQMMPANKQLDPLEIAEILTYVTNSWGNDAGLTSAREVGIWLNQCPPFAE